MSTVVDDAQQVAFTRVLHHDHRVVAVPQRTCTIHQSSPATPLQYAYTPASTTTIHQSSPATALQYAYTPACTLSIVVSARSSGTTTGRRKRACANFASLQFRQTSTDFHDNQVASQCIDADHCYTSSVVCVSVCLSVCLSVCWSRP